MKVTEPFTACRTGPLACPHPTSGNPSCNSKVTVHIERCMKSRPHGNSLFTLRVEVLFGLVGRRTIDFAGFQLSRLGERRYQHNNLEVANDIAIGQLSEISPSCQVDIAANESDCSISKQNVNSTCVTASRGNKVV